MTEIPPFRVATAADCEAIEALMKAAIRSHFPRFYAPHQIEPSIRYIGLVDRALVEDGTYYVATSAGEPVACGGWSRRFKLYTGSGEAEGDARLLDPATEPAPVRAMFVRDDFARRGLGTRILELCEDAARAEGFTTLTLMATLPGVQLYTAYGFRDLGDHDVTLADGTLVECKRMEKSVAS